MRNEPFPLGPFRLSAAGVADIVSEVSGACESGECRLVTFVNPYSFYLPKEAPEYAGLVAGFDHVLCDGIGVTKAVRLLKGPPLERISFDSTSLAGPVFSLCAERGLSVFLIGGKEGVASRAAEIILEQHPEVRIAGTRSGYFSDMDAVLSEIEGARPDVVVTGMGAPKQEEILIRLKGRGWTGAGFTCGGYLDQLGGGYQYYPAWVDRLNLRFAYRLAREPRRLWRRYLIQYWSFIFLVLKGLVNNGKR